MSRPKCKALDVHISDKNRRATSSCVCMLFTTQGWKSFMAATARTNARPHKVKLVKRVLLLPENARNTGVEKVQANMTCTSTSLFLTASTPTRQASPATFRSLVLVLCLCPVHVPCLPHDHGRVPVHLPSSCSLASVHRLRAVCRAVEHRVIQSSECCCRE